MIPVGGGRRSGPGEEKGTDVKSAGSGELREFGTFENIWAVIDQLRRISGTYNISKKIRGVTSSSLLHALCLGLRRRYSIWFKFCFPPTLPRGAGTVLPPKAGRAVEPARRV